MKQKIICAAMIFVVMITYGLQFNVYAEDLQEKDLGAISAILIDEKTGRTLWSKNPNEIRAIASTTKIMTCILALESGDINRKVIASKKACSMPETKMFLKEGEENTLENLLYALMLMSANDAAVAIAESVGENYDDFIKMMNDKAVEIGALNTNFSTPNGLDNGVVHVSTAYDLAIITRYALKNEKFKEIINTREREFQSLNTGKKYRVVNTNRMLNEYKDAFGVKTGFTNKAGHCFVGAFKCNGYNVISVVLASGWGSRGKEMKWTDTRRLFTYAKNDFFNKQIINIDQSIIDNIEVTSTYKEYNTVELFSKDGVVIPVKKGEKDFGIKKIIAQVNIIDNKVCAPIYKEDVIGYADIIVNDEKIANIEISSKINIIDNNIGNSFKKLVNHVVNII